MPLGMAKNKKKRMPYIKYYTLYTCAHTTHMYPRGVHSTVHKNTHTYTHTHTHSHTQANPHTHLCTEAQAKVHSYIYAH